MTTERPFEEPPEATHVIAPVRETAASIFNLGIDTVVELAIDGRHTTSSMAAYLGSAAQRIARFSPEAVLAARRLITRQRGKFPVESPRAQVACSR